ncbi:MAG TPA: ABC transporter permease [Candidatus Limnocylindrales bacterium]
MAATAIPQPAPRSGYLASYEHQVLLYLRNWRGSLFSNFAQPVLFLLAMGVGLGAYVDQNGSNATGGVPYLQFLAPALLVSSVMQGSAGEGTFPVLAGFQWVRRYYAMFATPLTPNAIAFGQLAWNATHALVVATIFCVVIILFGAAATPGIVLSVPIAVLTGIAFTAPIAAFMTTQSDTNAWLNIWRFGITPLFLFSGTFFPIDRLPELLRPIAWVLPLWHGVDLARSAALGTMGEQPLLAIAHLVILLVMAGGGTWAMFVMFRRKLEI